MKIIFVLAIFLAVPSFELSAGDICGSRSSLLNKFTKAYIIPDFWPPEKATPLVFAVSGQVCRPLGNARLYHGCERHDACYGRVGTDRDACDRGILHDWLDACDDAHSRDWYEHLYGVGEAKAVCQAQCRADVYEMAVILGIFGADAKKDAVSNTKKKAIISMISGMGPYYLNQPEE